MFYPEILEVLIGIVESYDAMFTEYFVSTEHALQGAVANGA